MRWPHKYKGKPIAGTLRRREVFLWIPRLDADSYWRWLEKAVVIEEWNQLFWVSEHGRSFRDGNFKWRIEHVLPRGATVDEKDTPPASQDL